MKWSTAARLVAIVGFGALLAWTLARLDVRAVGRLLLSIGPAAPLILFPYPVAMALDTLAWRRLLSPAAGRLPFSRLLGCRLGAEAVAALVPSGGLAGEAVAVAHLKQWGVTWPVAVASLAARRGVALLTHGLVIVLAVLVGMPIALEAPTPAARFPLRVSALRPAMAASAAVLILAAVVLYVLARRAGPRAPLASEVSRAASWCVLGAAVPLWILVWLTEAFETFLILALLGAGLAYRQALACESAASLVRAVAFFLPSGMGLQDGAYVGLLQATGVRDALACATAFVVLKRTKELVWIAVGYALLSRAGGSGDERSAQADPLHLRIAEPDDADAPGRARAAGA